MNKLAILGAAAVVSFAVTTADATEWKVLPEESTLTATGAYFFDFGAGAQSQKATVTFKTWTADITFDPANLAESRIHIEIDLTRAQGATQNVTDELLGSSWLNTEKNHTAVFDSASVTSKGGNAYEALGQLTLNGVTKDVTLPFEATIEPGEATAQGTTTILRNDFGIGAGSGESEVAYEVTVTFAIKATALTN